MATSTDVSLPRQLAPVFPAICVVCQETPDSTTKITLNSQNAFAAFLLPILGLFGWSRVEFPICYHCKSRFYIQRWARTLMTWGIILLAVFIAYPHFDGWNALTKKLALLGIVLLACLPYLAFEVFVPRSFDMTGARSRTTYEFASSETALQFYLANLEAYPTADIRIE